MSEMKRYGRIYDGLVVELHEDDRDMATLFHPDMKWVEIPKGTPVDCGWSWNEEDGFQAPPPPSDDDLAAEAIIRRQGYMELATIRIAPLQDAVDLDEATEEEIAKLKAWKSYRVQLSRLEAQTGFPRNITWPTVPE